MFFFNEIQSLCVESYSLILIWYQSLIVAERSRGVRRPERSKRVMSCALSKRVVIYASAEIGERVSPI